MASPAGGAERGELPSRAAPFWRAGERRRLQLLVFREWRKEQRVRLSEPGRPGSPAPAVRLPSNGARAVPWPGWDAGLALGAAASRRKQLVRSLIPLSGPAAGQRRLCIEIPGTEFLPEHLRAFCSLLFSLSHRCCQRCTCWVIARSAVFLELQPGFSPDT